MEESDSGQQPKRCPCGFWGSPQTSGLCSKCYKAVVQEKSQDGLDAKAELMRDRQSAYTSHDSIGASSSSYLATSCSQSSASDVEKASELLRQAVRNSSNNSGSVELGSINVPDTKDSSSTGSTKPSQDSEDAQKSVSSSSTSQTVSVSNGAESSGNSTEIASVQSNSKDSKTTEDTAKPGSLPSTPDKRGVKRDSSAMDESTPESTPEKPGTKSKRRCAVCSCKLELAQRTIGRCRCDNVYCSLHRLPELHDCQFDHKEDGRREAREKMVKPTRHLGTSFKRLGSDS